MKLIDIFKRIADGLAAPKYIKVCEQIWAYEEGFGQYKNDNCQELIKYLNGYYSGCDVGLTYKAIFNYEVEVIKF